MSVDRVALVGIKGKTTLARKMGKEGYEVVDNIPQKFSKQTGVLVGVFADPQVNTVLASLRFVEEYKRQDRSFVSTTTVLDSVVHAAHSMILLDEPNNENSSEYEFTVAYLSGWVMEHWNFNRTIYLPYKGKSEMSKDLDGYYQRAMEIVGIDFETID